MTVGHSSARRHALLTVALALVVLVSDQFSKMFVVAAMGPKGDVAVVQLIPGLLRLIFVRNTGAAFGIFQGRSPLLLVLAIGVVGFLLVSFRHSLAANRWLAVALGLQIGGAIGNIVDRLRYGYVVDFINVPHWPTFNLADSAITVGVFLLGFTLLFHDTGRTSGAAPSGRASEAAEQP